MHVTFTWPRQHVARIQITEDGPPRRRLWVRGDVNISTGGCIFSCSLTIIRSHPALYLSETRTCFTIIIIKDSGKSTPRIILLAAVAFIDGVTALFSFTTQKVMKDMEQETTRILSQSPPPSYSLHFWLLPFAYLHRVFNQTVLSQSVEEYVAMTTTRDQLETSPCYRIDDVTVTVVRKIGRMKDLFILSNWSFCIPCSKTRFLRLVGLRWTKGGGQVMWPSINISSDVSLKTTQLLHCVVVFVVLIWKRLWRKRSYRSIFPTIFSTTSNVCCYIVSRLLINLAYVHVEERMMTTMMTVMCRYPPQKCLLHVTRRIMINSRKVRQHDRRIVFGIPWSRSVCYYICTREWNVVECCDADQSPNRL